MSKQYRWFNHVTKEVVCSPKHPDPSDHEGLAGSWESHWCPIVNYQRIRFWDNHNYYKGTTEWDEYANNELYEQLNMVEVWNGKKFRTEKLFEYKEFIDGTPDVQPIRIGSYTRRA